MGNRVIFFEGPKGLEDWESCDTCGHYSTFVGGVEVSPSGEYVSGWFEDRVSCYGGVVYNPVEDEEDSLEGFRGFLEEHGYEEELAVLREIFG